MSARAERLLRVGFWVGLAATWLIAVWYMWEAMATLPSSVRLETTRQVAIPTLRTFYAAAIFSALELALVMAVLWPWRPEYYATRLTVAVLALATWFVITTPMDLSRMDWVHRVWLISTASLCLAALLALLLYRAIRWSRSRNTLRSA